MRNKIRIVDNYGDFEGKSFPNGKSQPSQPTLPPQQSPVLQRKPSDYTGLNIDFSPTSKPLDAGTIADYSKNPQFKIEDDLHDGSKFGLASIDGFDLADENTLRGMGYDDSQIANFKTFGTNKINNSAFDYLVKTGVFKKKPVPQAPPEPTQQDEGGYYNPSASNNYVSISNKGVYNDNYQPPAPQPTQADYDRQAEYEQWLAYKNANPNEFDGDTWVGQQAIPQEPEQNYAQYEEGFRGYAPPERSSQYDTASMLDSIFGRAWR